MKKIIYYLFLILPLVDLATSFCENSFEMIISIGIIFKGILILFSGIYVLFITKSKYKKKSIIYYSFLGIFGIIHILLGDISYITSITQIIKFMFLPILLIFFINYNDDYKISYIEIKKIIKYNLLFILSTILIAKLTNTGFNTYQDLNTSGVIGWYFSANEISNIIVILFPYFLENILQNKLGSFLIVIYIIFVTMLIGTKTSFLGVILALAALFIHIIISKEKKWKIIKVIFLILISSLSFFKFTYIDNVTSGRFENSQDVVFSSRNYYLKESFNQYLNSNLEEKIFGLGSKDIDISKKYIEMDFFDLLYRYGILGFAIFIIPYLMIIIKMLKYAFTHLKNYDYDKMILIFVTILALMISILAGHTISAPAVSIYFAISVVLYLNKDKEII